ncbi:unnamed protein product [Parajaminaea phylloscopi]
MRWLRHTIALSALLLAIARCSHGIEADSLLAARQAPSDDMPTGRGSCVRQSSGWVCELDSSVSASSSSSEAVGEEAAAPVAPAAQSAGTAPTPVAPNAAASSPTGQGHCHLHGDHWHCEAEEDTAGEAGHEHSHDESAHDHDHSHGDGEAAHDHAGHDHAGHDHAGHDHAGHDHAGHSHAGHSHGPSAQYGCGLAPLEHYNLPLHIGAIFILLAVTAVGCAIPHLANAISRAAGSSAASPAALAAVGTELRFILRHFGSGILLSTAFIHLLFHSFVYFSNECLGELKYEAASAAIALAAVYVAFLLDYIGLRSVRRRVWQARLALIARPGDKQVASDDEGKGADSPATAIDSDSASTLLEREEFRLNKWSIISLEAGIVFHSVIIGVTLGASSGEGWIPLFVAIIFHQFCEALGLVSRIAFVLDRTREGSHRFLKLVLHACFILSTSVGIAIGVGVRYSFNGNDKGTLLAIGTLDSISAGILLYSSLTQILPKDFLDNGQMLTCGWGRCATALLSFTLGLFVMSLLGYWA